MDAEPSKEIQDEFDAAGAAK